jgi:hypothetical protein
MSLFKKKTPKAKNYKTIQEVQADFNTAIFNLGRATYQKHLIETAVKRDIQPVEAEMRDLREKADQLGQIAQDMSQKAQAEVLRKVEEGKNSAEASSEAAS